MASNYSPRASPLADYVLLAEFDIDKGSSLSVQYPRPTGTDPSTLAEWMLPEGAHLRPEDCTYFVLNRTPVGKIVPDESVHPDLLNAGAHEVRIQAIAYIKRTSADWTLADKHGEVVLSLCNGTQLVIVHPESLSDNAWHISGSVCEYWDEFTVCFPLATPALAVRFRNADDRSYFMRFVHEMGQVTSANPATVVPDDLPPIPAEEEPLLYVINMVNMKHIAGARRGARVKAMAIASRHPWVHVFKPLLILALDMYFASPDKSVIADLFNVLNKADTRSIPILTFAERKTLRTHLRGVLDHKPDATQRKPRKPLNYADALDTKLELVDMTVDPDLLIAYANITLPLKIPISAYASEFGNFSMTLLLGMIAACQIASMPASSGQSQQAQGQSGSGNSGSAGAGSIKYRNDAPYFWHPHLDNGPQTHPLVVLVFALMTEKRVLFVGHGKPSSDVANCVLACAAIASGGDVVPDVISRCFPYVSLASLDLLLSVKGYIAGVTNPVFEEQTSWWDVLYNLNTGKLTISPKLVAENMTTPSTGQTGGYPEVSELDDQFIQEISIALQKRMDELHIRQTVYAYTETFITVATQTPNPRSTPTPYRNRIEAYTSTHAYRNVCQSRLYASKKTLFPHINVKAILGDLAAGASLPKDFVVSSYSLMDYLVQEASDDEMVELLSYVPGSNGGGVPFSLGLFHERPEVRMCAARIIQRMFLQKLGDKYVNAFIKRAVSRLLQPPDMPQPQPQLQLHHDAFLSSAVPQSETADTMYLGDPTMDYDGDGYDSYDSDTETGNTSVVAPPQQPTLLLQQHISPPRRVASVTSAAGRPDSPDDHSSVAGSAGARMGRSDDPRPMLPPKD